MVDRLIASERSQVQSASPSPADVADVESPAEGSAHPVGLVAGTEDSTPLQFAVALDEDSYLQLDDVVVTLRQVPGVGPVLTSGIVTQVRARHEGASFGSDVFLISDGVLPAGRQEIAEVSTTRVEPEIYVPPRPGEVVRRATGQERAQALYFDQSGWLGSATPHRVKCAQGHLSPPTPGNVGQGHGVCRFCASTEWDAFYVVTGGGAIKFGITAGDGRHRLRIHAGQGYTEVVRLVTGLPGTVALDTENAVKSALALAGEKPLRGREYFDATCLALILDVADSWLGAADKRTRTETIENAAVAIVWLQRKLFAARPITSLRSC